LNLKKEQRIAGFIQVTVHELVTMKAIGLLDDEDETGCCPSPLIPSPHAANPQWNRGVGRGGRLSPLRVGSSCRAFPDAPPTH
jgi:hypothetical protein